MQSRITTIAAAALTAVVLVVLAVVLGGPGAPDAQAQSGVRTKVTGELRVMPEAEAAKVRARWRQAGYDVPEPKPGSITSKGRAIGPCGTSWMHVYDAGANLARMYFGARSILGRIVRVEWSANFRLIPNDPYRFYSDIQPWNGWRWSQNRYPDAVVNGTYEGRLTKLVVLLRSGRVCYGLYPKGRRYID